MSSKGASKHKCQKCGALRSTQGMWCMKCITEHFNQKDAKPAFNFWDNLEVNAKATKALETPENFCIVCGRKVSDNARVIEIGVDGYEFGTTDETQSQGGFLVGSECAKAVAR